jgi:hypothetical protein
MRDTRYEVSSCILHGRTCWVWIITLLELLAALLAFGKR